MKKQQTRFERFEYKYWVPEAGAEQLLRFTAPFLRCDDWAPGGQRNTSLYLDSSEHDFMEQHRASAPDRFKLRVRTYDDAPGGSDAPAFFEIKRKVKAVTFKRRAEVPLAAVPKLLRGESVPGLRLRTADEEATLAQFQYLMMTHHAEPRVLLTCRRAAYTSVDPNDEVRLTVDREVSYQPARGFVLQGDPQRWIRLCGLGNYQPGASVLIELKFRGCAPWWVEELVQRLQLIPSRYSKYVAAMAFADLGPGGLLGNDLDRPQGAYAGREL